MKNIVSLTEPVQHANPFHSNEERVRAHNKKIQRMENIQAAYLTLLQDQGLAYSALPLAEKQGEQPSFSL